MTLPLPAAPSQPGFVGLDSAYGADRFGVSVSYWRDEPSIAARHDLARHAMSQADGRDARPNRLRQ
jgi:hypothetical protein